MLAQPKTIKLLFKGVTRKTLSVIFQILSTNIKYSSNANVCCDFYQLRLDLSDTTFFFSSVN